MPPVYYTLYTAASLWASVMAQNMCYFPDGSPSPTDFVCNSTTGDGFSSCCGHQLDNSAAYCMSNGLCLSDMFLSRGSCTDKSWKSLNCAQVCTHTTPGGGIGLRPCGYTNTWDCGNGSGCDTAAIKIPTGNFILTNAQLKAMGAETIPASSSASSSMGAAAAATSNPSGTSSRSAATATSSGVVQASQVTAVGAGVGIPLGILAASFLALWLFERSKSSKLRKQMTSEHQQFNSSGPGNAYQSSASGPSMGFKRMASSHGGIMSSSSGGNRNQNFGQAPPQMPLHPALRQDMEQQNKQATDMQRMMSTSGDQYSGSRNTYVGPGTPPPPPPPRPPKTVQHSLAREAPAEQIRRPNTGFVASELPTDRWP